MQKNGWNGRYHFRQIFSVNSRKGQVTLFIIIALLIVGILIFLLLWPTIKKGFVQEVSPEEYLKACTEQHVKEVVELVGKRGGSVNPGHAVSFQGEKIEYLCYTNEYYKTCVMQQPLLKQHVEYEIVNYVKPKVEECVQSLKGELEKRGYVVSSKRPDVSVSILPKNVHVDLKLGMSVTKDQTRSYDALRVSVKSPIYDLIMISGSILNYEAHYGDADPLAYMFYYPNLKVQKLKQEDGTKIYILQDRDSLQEFRFASRSLSWPAGYTGGVDTLALYPGREG